MLRTNTTFAICGALRRMGESDDSIYRLARENGLAKWKNSSCYTNSRLKNLCLSEKILKK